MTTPDACAAVEEIVGHRFRDRRLLETALTHPSLAHEVEGGRGNERLEFLGDAVLGLVVAGLLFDAHPDWTEGKLTRARADLVNRRALAARSRALGLDRYVGLGRTERRTGGARKDSILGNLFEAVIGAYFLDAGLEAVTEWLRELFAAQVAAATPVPERDPKTRFQEWAHAHFQSTPAYRMVSDSGAHDAADRFTVEVVIGGARWGRASARTKRLAERAAAEEALRRAEDGAEAAGGDPARSGAGDPSGQADRSRTGATGASAGGGRPAPADDRSGPVS